MPRNIKQSTLEERKIERHLEGKSEREISKPYISFLFLYIIQYLRNLQYICHMPQNSFQSKKIIESKMKYFGGIEGGATHSRLIICNKNGDCVASVGGMSTNHWILGVAECVTRLADMVKRAKDEANIPEETRLACLCLSLSGCEGESSQIELESKMRTTYPNIADKYVICSDTLGSIYTASRLGGMVIISGTGSNARLLNPNGKSYNCGGWGHILGDEGGAWHISHRAVKTVFDHMDNLAKSPYPIDHIWKLIKEHFNIETAQDILPHCYGKGFDKTFFANLCKKLSMAAEDGDPLALSLFKEAGHHIARHIGALLPNVQKDLVEEGHLSIVCVGSVWLSWKHLKDGFVQELNKHPIDYSLKLLRITKSAAFGACYLAADYVHYDMPRNYEDNYTVMFHYRGKEVLKTNGNDCIACMENNISL